MLFSRIVRIFLNVLSVLLLLTYPVLIYIGIVRFSPRVLGLITLFVLLPSLILRIRKQAKQHLRAVLPLPIAVISLLILSSIVNDHRFILALPVLINISLLFGFASTLRGPISMIERFARMQVDDLSEAEVRYCRTVTIIWCVFFAINALITLGLALFAPLSWWTIYAGAVCYVLMGILFTIEYLTRKFRFRRYGAGLHDKFFAWIFPPYPDNDTQ